MDNDEGVGIREVQRHVAETFWRLAEASRGNLDRSWGAHNALSILLDNAVAATSPFTGIDTSELVPWRTPLMRSADLVQGKAQQVLHDEAVWLIENPQIWNSYGNELMRVGERHAAAGENASSLGLEQVVLSICRGLALQERESLSILDPTCGRGTLLSALAHEYRATPTILAGQDVDQESLAMASRNLAIAGRVPILAEGDFLEVDGHPGAGFDLVVLDGPFGLLGSGREAHDNPRIPPELGPTQDPSWDVLLTALTKVKSADLGGGFLIATLRPNALWNPKRGPNQVRTWIQHQDLTHAVIALPDRVGSLATGIHTFVLVLSTLKPKGFVGRTQVVDLRGSFEGGPSRSQSRLISASGLEELKRAVAVAKPSGLVRTCTQSDFEYRNWTVTISGVSVIHDGRRSDQAVFEHMQPASESESTWPGSPGAKADGVSPVQGSEVLVSWDTDQVFGRRVSVSARRALGATGWPISPLLLLCTHVEYRRSSGAASGIDDSPWSPQTLILTIPLTSEGQVEFGPLEDFGDEHRVFMIELDAAIDGRFLAAWFATANGQVSLKAARESAFGSNSPGRTILRNSVISFLAHLMVPTPNPHEQERILDTHQLVNAGVSRLRELNADLWARPSSAAEIVSAVKGWSEEQDMESWASSLPYPLAIALRTVQAFEHDDEKAARQLVHFWEATATFLANYLISSLRAADDLWLEEVPRLRSALQGGGHTFERATMGTWRITVERLSRVFRSMLVGNDVDERDRARLLLGNPPESVIGGVLSLEIINLLSRLNEARNRLDGHAGTLTRSQAADVRANFAVLTDELRAILGYGWSDFPMIRQVGLDYDDSGFTVNAEVLVGPTTPFLTRKLPSPRALKKGRLYLLGDGGVVDLAPFVQLGKAPEDPETTCWFYNRKESRGVRLVAYQTADSSDVTRPDEQLEALLHDLGTLVAGAEFPDLFMLGDS